MNTLLWGLPVVASVGVVARGVFAPRSGLFHPVVSRLDEKEHQVALTFDDGPCPGSTDRILDELGSRGHHATFFVIGRYVQQHPQLIQRIFDEGHQLGNHTFDHHRAGLFRGPGYWADQIARTDDAIAQIVGEAPTVFRPPMGFKAPPQCAAMRRSGHQVIAWSRRAFDGVSNSPERVIRSGKRLLAGDIMLLHDGRDPSSKKEPSGAGAAMPELLTDLEDRGLRSVRIDEGVRSQSPG